MSTPNKTQQTDASVEAFIAATCTPRRQDEAHQLCRLMTEVTGEPPAMWGPTMIGFGRYHYKYESGHEGDAMRVGFSPRKARLSLYLLPGLDGYEALLARLGKHSTGVACLYVNKLADIDMGVLRELVESAWAEMNRRYPQP